MRAVATRRPSVGSAAAAAAPVNIKEMSVALFAGFGAVPKGALSMPGYALRVVRRTLVLRRSLEIARKHHPSEVALHELAMASADARAVATGIAMLAVGFAMAALFIGVLASQR